MDDEMRPGTLALEFETTIDVDHLASVLHRQPGYRLERRDDGKWTQWKISSEILGTELSIGFVQVSPILVPDGRLCIQFFTTNENMPPLVVPLPILQERFPDVVIGEDYLDDRWLAEHYEEILESFGEYRECDPLLQRFIEGVIADVREFESVQIGGEAETKRVDAQDEKITKDRALKLLEDEEMMTPLMRGRGYDNATAKSIVTAMLTAHGLRHEWVTWNATAIAGYCQCRPKKKPITSNTVGRYLNAMWYRGIRTIDGVSIPKPRKRKSRVDSS